MSLVNREETGQRRDCDNTAAGGVDDLEPSGRGVPFCSILTTVLTQFDALSSKGSILFYCGKA